MKTNARKFLLADGNMIKLLSYMQHNAGTVHSRMFLRGISQLPTEVTHLVRHLESLHSKSFAELELRRIRSGVLAKCYSLSYTGKGLSESLLNSGIGLVRL